MPHCENYGRIHSRRDFLNKLGAGLGAVGLSSLINPLGASPDLFARPQVQGVGGIPGLGNIVPRAKRVIYLFQSGGPSQYELFSHKPTLRERHGEELPPSVINGQRLTGMSAGQGALPMVGSAFEFKRYGRCGKWLSDRVPHLASIADELCWVDSMYTDAINHDPAVMFIQTGSQFPAGPASALGRVTGWVR